MVHPYVRFRGCAKYESRAGRVREQEDWLREVDACDKLLGPVPLRGELLRGSLARVRNSGFGEDPTFCGRLNIMDMGVTLARSHEPPGAHKAAGDDIHVSERHEACHSREFCTGLRDALGCRLDSPKPMQKEQDCHSYRNTSALPRGLAGFPRVAEFYVALLRGWHGTGSMTKYPRASGPSSRAPSSKSAASPHKDAPQEMFPATATRLAALCQRISRDAVQELCSAELSQWLVTLDAREAELEKLFAAVQGGLVREQRLKECADKELQEQLSELGRRRSAIEAQLRTDQAALLSAKSALQEIEAETLRAQERHKLIQSDIRNGQEAFKAHDCTCDEQESSPAEVVCSFRNEVALVFDGWLAKDSGRLRKWL